MTTPKKARKLPPRGQKGRFVKVSGPSASLEPELVGAPTYSPHRIGVGEPIDWQRELKQEVLRPRRRAPRVVSMIRHSDAKLGWGVLGLGAVGIGYALSRLPSKGRHL